MKEKILSYIEKNSRIDLHELAVLVDADEASLMNTLEEMENDNIICGYHTLINWEKTDLEKVTALIEVKVTPQRGQGFDKIAERLYNYPEVKSVYLISGGYDLLVTLEEKSLKEISNFVSFKLSTLDSLAFPSKGLMANFSVAGIFPLSKEERDKEFFFDKLEAFVTVAIPLGKKFSLALDIKAGGSVSESLNSLPEMKMPYAFSQKDRLFFSNVASINPLATNMACSAASLYFFPQTSLSMAGIKCMTGFSAAQGFFWDSREDMQSGKGVWRVSLDAGIQFKKNSALLLRVGGGFVQEKVSPFVSLDLGAFRM